MPEELKGQVGGQPGQPGAADSKSQPGATQGPEPSQLPDDTKVKLADGRVVTFGELQKGVMFEADYRKKTSALAEEKRNLEEEKARLSRGPTLSSPRVGGPEAYSEETEEPDPILILAEQVRNVQAFQAHQLLAGEIERHSREFPDADKETVYKICWANPRSTDIGEEMKRSHEKIVAVKTPPKERYLDLTDPAAKAAYEDELIAKYNAKKSTGGGSGGFATGAGAGTTVTDPSKPPKDMKEAGDRLRNALKSLPPE